MEATGSLVTNDDMSHDMNLGVTDGTLSANTYLTGYKDGKFSAAGANLGVQTGVAGVGLEAATISNFGKQVTASANANILNLNDHKLNVNAYHTSNIADAGPSYTVQGIAADYSYKDKVALGASKIIIPEAKIQQNNLTGNLNLMKTENSSLTLGVGATQNVTPFDRKWEKKGTLSFRMKF